MRYQLRALLAIFGLLAIALLIHFWLGRPETGLFPHEILPGSDSLARAGHSATEIAVVEAKTPVTASAPLLDGDGLPAPPLPEKSIIINAEKPHPGAYVRPSGGSCPDGGSPFCTHLPIVSLDAGGAFPPIIEAPVSGEVGVEVFSAFLRCKVSIYDSETKVNHLSDTPTMESQGLFRPRGNSSIHFDKPPYKLHLIKEEGENPLPFLGLAEHDKWVLNGPILDKTLLRNYIGLSTMGELRPETPDVRFFELFINGRYQGVYLAIESVAVGEDRVPITPYEEGDPFGSYILRSDRDVGQSAKADIFTSYGEFRRSASAVEILYPSEEKLTPELRNYIEQDMSFIEKSLYSYDYNHPTYGYRATTDVDSFVDYFIINEFFRNFDAGVYSTYYYKDIRGKLVIGPAWDFNNAVENYISYLRGHEGFVLPEYPLFQMMCMDDYFTASIISRYRELRKSLLNEETLMRRIDEADQWLGSAVTRNFQVWGYTFDPEMVNHFNKLSPAERTPANHQVAIEQMQDYIKKRGAWLDEHIEVLKQYSHSSFNKKYQH